MLSPTFERGQGKRPSVRDLWLLQSLPSFGADDGSIEQYFVHRVTGTQQWDAPPGFFLDEVERQLSNESIDDLLRASASPADVLTHIGLVPLSTSFLALSEAFEAGEDSARSVDVTPLHLAFLRLRRARIRSLRHFGEPAWIKASSAFGCSLPNTIASFLTSYLPPATAMEGAILLSEMSISDVRIANGLINGEISSIDSMITECTTGLKRALFGRKEAIEFRAANGECVLKNDSGTVDSYMLIAWLQLLVILLESYVNGSRIMVIGHEQQQQQQQQYRLSNSHLRSLSAVLFEILQCSSVNPNGSLCSLRIIGLLFSLVSDVHDDHEQKSRYLLDAVKIEGFGSMLVRALDGLLDSTVSDSTAETVFQVLASESPTKSEESLTVISLNQDLLLLSLLRFASALIEYKTFDSPSGESTISSSLHLSSSPSHCILYSSDAKVLLEIAIRECSNLPDGAWRIRSAWFVLIHALLHSSVWYEGGINKNLEMINKLEELSLAYSTNLVEEEKDLFYSAKSVCCALKESERMLSEI